MKLPAKKPPLAKNMPTPGRICRDEVHHRADLFFAYRTKVSPAGEFYSVQLSEQNGKQDTLNLLWHLCVILNVFSSIIFLRYCCFFH